jgi:putative lysine transport system substrate-binding protein
MENHLKGQKKMKRLMTLLLAVAMMLSVAACSSSSSTTTAETTTDTTEAPAEAVETTETAEETADEADDAIPGLEDGVLTIAMECAYAPYNWTQYDDSNGAVPISGTTGEYANGYDVMIAKKICEANGWELEVIRTDWDSLVPGVQSGLYDAVIAGQSMTEERSQSVDFAGPYFYASIVCVTLADSEYANAQGLADLAGGSCTAQIATIWYDSMLEQIPDANIQTAAETAPAMLMALETGSVDFICTDMPTALGAVAAYDDMVLLDFSGSDDNFVADEGEINIGVSVMKGNTQLKDAIDSVLSTMTVDDFNALMDEAISIQPLSE